MSQVTISKLAIEKIMSDPQFSEFKEHEPTPAVPLLYYYQRSFSTLHDGRVIEYGAGFMLTFVKPEEIREAVDVAYETVAIADGVNVTVGGARGVFSNAFNIGWSNAKFTFEPQVSL
jgi:hypothetical protein